MQVIAKLNYLRIAPRKMRLLVDLIRGKKVQEAMALLDFSPKKGSRPLKKVLEQAIANAENNFQLKKSSLYISKITIDEGPKLKRWRARARGRAARIEKKTSHISLVLNEIKEKREAKKVKRVRVEEKKKVKKVKEVEKAPKFKLEKRKILRPTKETKGFKRVFRRKAF
ncbi:50S ribosomal protein L22 [bacterium (Candidatus Gribaldobacteria) CG_4_9_14_3_um_filter_36_15]|uniref:Large ribosomal subunit protein uL22 n=4 Tax=Candidatus Gribaldobacteria TaxID=2798536 RepID=A0A2M7VJK7_9BACT|nr:MAG: 50S ribosomal protein L22 [Parcubacteria group bacterium CG2_30_36_21]PIR91308.1 MAG: 50S ribosomal protein L22 [bacterium (Candidatus Gribaldobacteria) CG10_big_fil_rev_8_21_14_0_10_37_46]PIV14098.1 MAG: 50S ribosomal protein L22 [bacterium (Candidatus Gribaldobacteria) CG03_land_8_20_14_0_80_36_40]PJA02037.1 MAG: 50S ribosomal protein L22 [bacterium (Candidatus Gribaldobacteria) CG_4_10_14_0_2_um_filter_36_18]PJB09214.1 MAG: 50S ribosomal protein L22 [bacterium (Candidatus Gribaldobac